MNSDVIERSGHEERISAVLLAAGQSKRMGAFKPLLPFGNKTVIESCIDYLNRGGVATIVVVVGHRAEEIRSQLKTAGVLFAVNPEPDSEMAVSIQHGVRQLGSSTGATLIALVDQPAIPPSVVRSVIERWKQGAKIVKPQFKERGGHPVLVDLSFRDELLNLDSQRGLRGFLTSHQDQLCRLPVESPFVASDMDTWDDYLTLHQEIFGLPPDQVPGNQPN